MIRVSLTQRLTLIFALIFIVSCMFISWIQHEGMTRYTNSVVQDLYRDLATTIVQNNTLINDDGSVNADADEVFTQILSCNPGVDLYLTDPKGKIIAGTIPPSARQRQQINVSAIQQWLQVPDEVVYGDAPDLDRGGKVFSAAAITRDHNTLGYLYIILQGASST